MSQRMSQFADGRMGAPLEAIDQLRVVPLRSLAPALESPEHRISNRGIRQIGADGLRFITGEVDTLTDSAPAADVVA